MRQLQTSCRLVGDTAGLSNLNANTFHQKNGDFIFRKHIDDYILFPPFYSKKKT